MKKNRMHNNNDLEYIWKTLSSALANRSPQIANVDFNAVKELAIKLEQRSEEKMNVNSIKLALTLVLDAKSDLKDSIILFNQKRYNSSIFHLQQSVEKGCKSFGLGIGTLEEHDLKRIGHKSPLVFIRIVEEPIVKYMLPVLGSAQTNLKIEKAKNTILKSSAELLRLDKNTIDRLLSLVDKISEKVMPRSNQIQQIIKDTLPDLEFPYNWGELILLSTTIYIIGVLSYAHEETTRYSDESSMKPTDYVEDLPIVKALPKMHTQMSEALEYLEKYIGSNRV